MTSPNISVPEKRIVLKLPKWNPKQKIAFDTEATDLLFGGATRGGKSFFVRKALIIWCSQIPDLQCDIFRLNHDDVIAENMEGDTSFPALLAEWHRHGLVTINQTEVIFWNGARISLEHCADDKVMLKHQGIAKHVRVFSESTQIQQRRIKWLSAWVTMSKEMQARVPEKWAGRFPKIIHVTNPIGVSAPYYRREYVKARPKYTIEKVGPWRRQYIPALVTDNPHEDAETTKLRLNEMGDAAIADAMINENWDALVGEFFPEWDENRHVVKDFIPPAHWFRYRAFDWGTFEPACVLWVAVSDGEPFKDTQGNQRWFPRGARIFYNEWYIANEQKPAEGLRLRNSEMAQGIKERSEMGFEKVPTLADSKPFQDTGGDNPAMEFQRAGVVLTQVPTPPGSRVAGWSMVRDCLIGIPWNLTQDGKPIKLPMAYFCECCKYTRDYIPALSRHPSEAKKEDAAEHGEATHATDTVRLALMAHTVIKDLMTPLNSRVQQEVKRFQRPTMKKIMSANGGNFFR